ncbi:MAG TPA: PDZ domain-containing protein [Actinomycetes bacterium]
MPDRSTAQLLAAVLVAVGLLVAVSLPVPYVIESPGPVFNVLGSSPAGPLVTISGARTYPTSGALDLTTVSERGGPGNRVLLTGLVGAWLTSTDAVVPRALLYPDSKSAAQITNDNTSQMAQSQDAAAIAALRHLGLPVTLTVVVGDIDAGSPADGHLISGDRIVSVDGTPVTTADGVRAAVTKHQPGEKVVFVVVRAGKTLIVPLTTVASTDSGPRRAIVGFTPGVGYTSPVKVTIQLNDVGGPSAGLMFTLGIIDKLTPQQENGGRHVAGTGTMDENGNVGAIGGIRQKMAAARADGATIFLVPASNCAEALMQVPDGLRLVKVTTVSDALTGLAAAVTGRGTAPSCS